MGLLQTPLLGAKPPPHAAILVVTALIGTLSMHIVVPVLPDVARDFDVSAGEIQLTITLYLLGVSIGQLIYGPLSDRLGRRPVLMAGLVIYLCSMAAAALSPGLGVLLLSRAFQALGGSCAMVMSRAIVRDGGEGAGVIKNMAKISMVMSLTPAVAPIVGASVSGWYGWRMIFWGLAIASGAMLTIIAFLLPETNRNKIPLPGIAPMLASYGALIRQSRFVGYAIGGSCGTSFYAFLTASPFLFSAVLHRTPQETGALYFLTLMGFAIGSFITIRIASRVRGIRMARSGNLVMIAGPLIMLFAHLTGALSLVTIMGPMLLFTVGAGLSGPFAQAGAVGADRTRIGAASGLYGATQTLFGSLCSFLVSINGSDPVLPMILVMLAGTIIGQIGYRMVPDA